MFGPIYTPVPFLFINLVPSLRIGSSAHLANTGAAPIETPIRTGSNACSSTLVLYTVFRASKIGLTLTTT
jgi:hypothetical protein